MSANGFSDTVAATEDAVAATTRTESSVSSSTYCLSDFSSRTQSIWLWTGLLGQPFALNGSTRLDVICGERCKIGLKLPCKEIYLEDCIKYGEQKEATKVLDMWE